MYLVVKNENYGYSVATYGDYVVVSNPAITRFNSISQSVIRTGSIDYFRYNKSTDQHDLIGELYLNSSILDILLAAESSSVPSLRDPLHTELNNTGSSYNKDIEIDKNLYTSSFEDGFGLSLDMYGKLLVAGSPYSLKAVKTSASLSQVSESLVNIFDVSLSELLTFSTASNIWVYTIDNPDNNVTESFGKSVSINNSWIAVGSPYASGSNGLVYIYQNLSTGSGDYNWQLFQALTSSVVGDLFGWSLKLNKQSGSYSGSLIVGCGNPSTNKAFYFEFISGSWQLTYTFNSDTSTQYPLTFGDFTPYSTTMSLSNSYGYAVSTFGTTVIIGEYLDRSVYEFSGSAKYNQGSVSIYEKCPSPNNAFMLALKTYGTSSILKNNRLGFSVDIFGNNAIAGIPKTNNQSMTSDFVGGSLQQLHQCPDTPYSAVEGQAMFFQKNTSSNDWEIVNIYQRKKRFLSPYRDFGNSVAINGRSMVVGAPMLLSDTNREITLSVTQSNNSTLDDVTGKAYIYNLSNLRHDFHVGNVFYRNGKIILTTSGSIFDALLSSPTSTTAYQYDVLFQGQHTIFEKQVVCSINPGEFNVSTNPTAIFKQTSSLDINGNGTVDFQDIDVILRYMQYKNTALLGAVVSTDWSSSIVTANDEISVLNYYQSLPSYNVNHTSILASESIVRWETTDTWMQNVLDLNQDNRIDSRDMNILWKYFTNRLTQTNYIKYTTSTAQIKIFSDIIDHLNFLTQRNSLPQIKSSFLDYDRLTASDKTGSFMTPVATTIGLYSGLDLVCLAKLGSPIKITPELPINFIVKMDY